MENQIMKSMDDHKDELIQSLVSIIKNYAEVIQLGREISEIASRINMLSCAVEEMTKTGDATVLVEQIRCLSIEAAEKEKVYAQKATELLSAVSRVSEQMTELSIMIPANPIDVAVSVRS